MWAEVIGDPIAHSKSPAIYGFWLDCLGMDAAYKATRVTDLDKYFDERREDPDWRGCNVTIPHKQAVIPFLAEVRTTVGAVNCIVPEEGRLMGRNTDVDGIAEALAGADLSKCIVIGAGGGAKAALAFFEQVGEVVQITRPNIENVELLAGATVVVNATPMGMAHADPMPRALLDALPAGATALDMVYQPLDTPFLQAARDRGLHAVDGLEMLVGQAREAFRLFFGVAPPRDRDAELRALLTA